MSDDTSDSLFNEVDPASRVVPTPLERFLTKHSNWARRYFRSTENRIAFRKYCYICSAVMSLFLLVTLVVYLYFINHVLYFLAKSIVDKENLWKYYPNLPGLEQRSAETTVGLDIKTFVTPHDFIKLRKQSTMLTNDQIMTGNLNDMNLTLPDIFRAHARIMEKNNLDCVCGPMYGVQLNVMTFKRYVSSSVFSTVNAVNTELVFPPSSVQRMDDSLKNKERYKFDNHHLIDIYHEKTKEERSKKNEWYLSQDAVLKERLRYSKKLIEVPYQPDFVNWMADQVSVVFPDRIVVRYSMLGQDSIIETELYDATCVETCILLMQGNTLFDISSDN